MQDALDFDTLLTGDSQTESWKRFSSACRQAVQMATLRSSGVNSISTICALVDPTWQPAQVAAARAALLLLLWDLSVRGLNHMHVVSWIRQVGLANSAEDLLSLVAAGSAQSLCTSSGAMLAQTIVAYLSKQAIAGPISLEQTAEIVGRSANYVSTVLRTYTGLTFWAHVRMARVNAACDLLRRTQLSVKEISARVGYTQSSHLARHLRQATGLSGKKYRQVVQRLDSFVEADHIERSQIVPTDK